MKSQRCDIKRQKLIEDDKRMIKEWKLAKLLTK